MTTEKSGFLPTVWRRLFGERAHTLREEEGHTSLAGMVLLIILSAAMVVVFGHAELPWLLTGTLPVRVLMAGSLAILALGTFVADQTALRSMLRMSILARNRATGMLWEHALYVGLVIATEMLTYILALYVIESDPARLLSAQPILPGGLVAIGLLALRGLIIGWTLVQ
ncbi:MAG TPA: hypothetical protein VMV29_03395, partial [Ktedonobacterales bacterium]|nr:hypothetical protein [Ktedonobacterales bacterium]